MIIFYLLVRLKTCILLISFENFGQCFQTDRLPVLGGPFGLHTGFRLIMPANRLGFLGGPFGVSRLKIISDSVF